MNVKSTSANKGGISLLVILISIMLFGCGKDGVSPTPPPAKVVAKAFIPTIYRIKMEQTITAAGDTLAPIASTCTKAYSFSTQPNNGYTLTTTCSPNVTSGAWTLSSWGIVNGVTGGTLALTNDHTYTVQLTNDRATIILITKSTKYTLYSDVIASGAVSSN